MHYDSAFWGKYFRYYDMLNDAPPYEDLLERVVRLCEARPGSRVLDAGTGTGNLVVRLCRSGADVVAIDANEHGLAIARKKQPGATYFQANLERPLPFDDATFDAVALVNVLYTLSEEGRASILGEIRRVLLPGGRLVVAVPLRSFKPFSVYTETVRRWLRSDGLLAGTARVARFAVPTIAVLKYNREIKEREGQRSYHFYEPEELVVALRQFGYRPEVPERAYADQVLVCRGSVG